MAEARGLRPNPVVVWALCLLAGLLVGVARFGADSNDPTYLPPGLRLTDAAYLAGDWWLNSARHYHWAFFQLVAILAKFKLLEPGLAVFNVLTVAAGMFGCSRIILRLRAERPLVAVVLVIALVLASYGFYTVGAADLFTASLQPSTIATSATILAMDAFLERRLGACGLWLALAGIFHANFLVLNFAAFGLAHALEGLAIRPARWRELLRREVVFVALRLLGPSIVVMVITLPLIISFQTERLSPALAARADWIFFHFAVPFHYYPRSWLRQFLPFLGLQALGLIWTARAVPNVEVRRLALALQISFAALIWVASALTTLVFIPFVSRAFVWRLAPFALLLAAILATVGLLRVIAGPAHDRTNASADARRLLLSLCALPLVAVRGAPLVGQWLPTSPYEPMLIILAGLCIWAVVRQRAGEGRGPGRAVLIVSASAALGFSVLTQPSPDPRYSLIVKTPSQQLQDELFSFVAQVTPPSAQFLIPPTLDLFRLRTARAVVVDFKALPLNRAGVAEWYRRLEDVSGVRDPSNQQEITRGYEAMNGARLETLRCRYGLTDAVLSVSNRLEVPGWREVFRNGSYRMLHYTQFSKCQPSSGKIRSLPL